MATGGSAGAYVCELHHREIWRVQALVDIVLGPVGSHQACRKKRQRGWENQLGIQLNHLGKKLGRQLGLVQVVEHRIEHSDNLRPPKRSVFARHYRHRVADGLHYQQKRFHLFFTILKCGLSTTNWVRNGNGSVATSGERVDPSWGLMSKRHAQQLALGLMALLGGCQVLSLPPQSSRTDGGPVSARGVVSHEARSQLRIYVDAAGCKSVQTVSRQFRLVSVVGQGEPEHRVLEESFDVRHCLSSESSSSEAVITAWSPDSPASSTPLFRITGRGTTGAPFGNLYRMAVYGCCGSQDLGSYSSLLSGRTLFTSSIRPRMIEVANRRTPRFAAFHDTFSALAPAEAEADSSVVGVLQWGDDLTEARRFVVRAEQPEAFAVESLRILDEGKVQDDSTVVIWPDKPPRSLVLEVRLVAPGSSRRASFRVPIVNLELATDKATVSRAFRLSGGT